MTADPTDDELLEFVGAMLSNLDQQLRDSAVLTQALADNRALWLMLYRASLDFEEAADSGA